LEELEAKRLCAGRVDGGLERLELVDVDRVQVTVTIEAGLGQGPERWGLALYRSADEMLDEGDVELGRWEITVREGSGELSDGRTIRRVEMLRLEEPFRIVPRRPYVLAALDPEQAVDEADETNNVAAARRYSVVIVTHGGFQETRDGDVPWWQKRLGRELAEQGYDDVLLYNWVGESKIAGALRWQPARLIHRLGKRLREVPDGQPVDTHWIGHSQGAVINGLALERLERQPLEGMRGGVIQATLLDPHAASNAAPLRQYSVRPSVMGRLARLLINDYQGRARDPAARVPGNVDEAVVYYQLTYYAFAEHEDQRLFNLWGQVPVRGAARYVDITGPGISHSGPYSVVDWYREHIVPGLGEGVGEAPPILTAGLAAGAGRIERRDPPQGHLGETLWMRTTVAAPRFEGLSWPGARVRLTAAPVGVVTDRPIVLGMAMADGQGQWSFTTRPLPEGRYTVIASAVVDASAAYPRIKMTPRIRVGKLWVEPAGSPDVGEAEQGAGWPWRRGLALPRGRPGR
jgi:hypothetical protein